MSIVSERYRAKVGARLRALREQQDLSQEDTAHELGVTTKTLSRWENGKTWPYPHHWKRIAAYFGVDPREDIERDDAVAAAAESIEARMQTLEDRFVQLAETMVANQQQGLANQRQLLENQREQLDRLCQLTLSQQEREDLRRLAELERRLSESEPDRSAGGSGNPSGSPRLAAESTRRVA